MGRFVGRAGEKLDFALEHFGVVVSEKTAADFGSAVGGFVNCLLTRGARRVYAVETGYGVLDYRLRKDPRVVVMERTNAMHVVLPEKVGIITIDASWTKQRNIVPNALKNLETGGVILSLVKPHYESGRARMELEEAKSAAGKTVEELKDLGLEVSEPVESPVTGEKGGNVEYWVKIG